MGPWVQERGADPNAWKVNGDGALHWACYRGEKAMVLELLAGAYTRPIFGST